MSNCRLPHNCTLSVWRAFDHSVGILRGLPYMNASPQHFWICWPPSPIIRLQQLIYNTKFTQAPLLCLVSPNPSPHQVQMSYLEAPQCKIQGFQLHVTFLDRIHNSTNGVQTSRDDSGYGLTGYGGYGFVASYTILTVYYCNRSNLALFNRY